MVADEHHEEDEDEECTVFQKEMKEGEEKEEILDSRSNSSEQSLEEEQYEGESQPSLSFVTVKDEVSEVGRVVEKEEGEGDESGDEEDGKVVTHTLKVEKEVNEVEVEEEQEEKEEEGGIHLHFKMDTTLRAKDRVYISSYGNQV